MTSNELGLDRLADAVINYMEVAAEGGEQIRASESLVARTRQRLALFNGESPC